MAELEPPGREPAPDAGGFPLRLIGLRELRSHNSWMHNAPLLMRGERVHALRVHPDDAAAHGLEDGGTARLESKSGGGGGARGGDRRDDARARWPCRTAGATRGGWQLANANAGVNVNLLASAAPEDLEPLAGMAHLNGIPVRVSPVSAPAAAEPRQGSGAVTLTVVPESELSIVSSPSSSSVRSRIVASPM